MMLANRNLDRRRSLRIATNRRSAPAATAPGHGMPLALILGSRTMWRLDLFDRRPLRDPRVVDLRAVAARRRRLQQPVKAPSAAQGVARARPTHEWQRWVCMVALIV